MRNKRQAKPKAAKAEQIQVQQAPKQAPVEVKQELKSGFMCPDCNFKLRVYYTKSLTNGTLRQRICDRCGRKVDTEEQVIK